MCRGDQEHTGSVHHHTASVDSGATAATNEVKNRIQQFKLQVPIHSIRHISNEISRTEKMFNITEKISCKKLAVDILHNKKSF